MSIRNAKDNESWIERVEPKAEWIVGDNMRDVFVNFLPALEWASKSLSPRDWIYNTFAMRNSGSVKPPLIAWTLAGHQPSLKEEGGLKSHVTMTLESTSFGIGGDHKARYTADGTYKVFANGVVYGTASLRYGGSTALSYGLRIDDGVLTWVKTGESIWVTKNDIEQAMQPSCLSGLATAIGTYFRSRGDSSNPEVRRISSEMRGLVVPDGGYGYVPLSPRDLYVFNALVEYHKKGMAAQMDFYDLEDDVEYLKGAYAFVKRLYDLAPQ